MSADRPLLDAKAKAEIDKFVFSWGYAVYGERSAVAEERGPRP
jgi:hypothetical protein